MEPGAIYYLVLYALIIVLQFFKTYPGVREKRDKLNWRHYFFVSLEVVYTSAGVAILLVAQQKEWIAVIMMVYVMLVVISSFLNTVGAEFKDNTRLAIHILIITIIVGTTVFSYAKLLPSSLPQSKEPVDYIVTVPYRDLTLEKHVGPRMGEKKLLYRTTVKGASPNDAITNAKEKALSNGQDSITPFDSKQRASQAVILISDEAMALESIVKEEKRKQ